MIIVGVGAGLSYASLGATHHACEDIGMLRVLPELAIVCPGDAYEVRSALRAAVAHDGPVYLRLGKKGEAIVHSNIPPLVVGRSLQLRAGTDVALLSVGTMLPIVVAAAVELERRGLSVGVESFHTIKPLDTDCLARVFSECPIVATLEEHSVVGGLSSAVAEWVVQQPPRRAQLISIATPDAFIHETGTQSDARRRLGLTTDAIVARLWESHARGRGDV